MSFYIRFLHKFRWPLALLFIILFAGSVHVARALKIRSDFKELLPNNFQSVKDLNRIVARVGGTGTLIVAIESDDPQASIRFGKDLVKKFENYPPGIIQKVSYNVANVKNFFQTNKYLYMDLADLQEVHDRLQRKIQREKIKKTGLFLDLETKEEKNNEFNTKDIEDKYRSKSGHYDQYIDGYFFGEEGRLMAVVITPLGASTGVEFSKKLVAMVNQTIQELNPTSYHPSMKVGLTGKFRRVLFEYQTLINDIVSTALLCVSLVGLAVFFYYRRIRMVLLMAWAVFNGTAWTFAITTWKIGYLTSQTAFLGSIIVGNGINYGLILMARYLEERKRSYAPKKSLGIAIRATLEGTFASSINTSVAFGVLIITQVKGFSHFGFIGGLGMVLCWVATYTVLPVFLLISEEIWPLIKETNDKSFFTRWLQFSPMSYLSERLPSWSRRITKTGLGVSVLCLPLLITYIPHSLEYNFTKLRIKSKGGQEVSEEAALNNRVKKIFGDSLSPAVLVTDRIDQVVPLCDEILRKNNLDPPDKQVVANCKSVYSYVPKDQEAKIKILGEMRHLLEDKTLHFLSDAQKAEVEKFKNEFVGKTLSLSDLPEDVTENYREKNGDLGKVVSVFPTDKAPLWDGKNLIHFADIIRENHLPDGSVITASGDSVIFADLLRAVIHDGPRATLLAFLGVCLAVSLIFRNKKAIAFIIGTLLFGILWMGGMMALFGLKINFFNFIAIPTTFGIGVDYGVNIYQRYKLEGKGSLPYVLKTTGGAVALCSLTTIIGYSTFIIAKNQALVSFGWIAIIGELTCLTAALIFIPALITWRAKKSNYSPSN